MDQSSADWAKKSFDILIDGGNPDIPFDDVCSVLKNGEKKPINPWPDEECKVPSRHMLIGASEQGKTFAIFAFLMHHKNPYVFPYGRTLYIIHPTSKDQVKIKNLEGYLNKQVNKAAAPDYKSFKVEINKSLNNIAGVIKDFVDECKGDKRNPLVIVDDGYGTDTMNSNFLVELYVKGRHLNISVAILTQVAFCSKVLKDCKRQVNYAWIFKTWHEDLTPVIKTMLDKNEWEYVWECYYKYVNKQPKGYIVIEPFANDRAHLVRINSFFVPGAKPKTKEELSKDFEELHAPRDDHMDDYVHSRNVAIDKFTEPYRSGDRADEPDARPGESDPEPSSSESDFEKHLSEVQKLRALIKQYNAATKSKTK